MEETKIKRPEIVGDDSLVLYCNQYSYYCQKVKFYTHTYFAGKKRYDLVTGWQFGKLLAMMVIFGIVESMN